MSNRPFIIIFLFFSFTVCQSQEYLILDTTQSNLQFTQIDQMLVNNYPGQTVFLNVDVDYDGIIQHLKDRITTINTLCSDYINQFCENIPSAGHSKTLKSKAYPTG